MASFVEFFAGGGMARLGLGPGWRCLLANEIDPRKGAVYADNFGPEALLLQDVRRLDVADIPGRPDLAWASFPCQDLSLAGAGGGLAGARSGTFFAFWRLMEGLAADGRAPPLIVLENVSGALTAKGGRDFGDICRALAAGGYRVGVLMIDAGLFVAQSRPRLFFIAARLAQCPSALTCPAPAAPFHTPGLIRAAERLTGHVWWRLPAPPRATPAIGQALEDGSQVRWHSPAQTARLVALMSPSNRAKLAAANAGGGRHIGSLYRRTRLEQGRKVQRAEVRFDGLAGCLRTPGGGSSRQTLVVVDGEGVRTRLLSPRETARLMGLPDSYRLPVSATDAYHLTGDGLVVPVVRHLARHLLEPLLRSIGEQRAAA